MIHVYDHDSGGVRVLDSVLTRILKLTMLDRTMLISLKRFTSQPYWTGCFLNAPRFSVPSSETGINLALVRRRKAQLVCSQPSIRLTEVARLLLKELE